MRLLSGSGLHLAFNGTAILNGIDLQLERGEMLGLIGPNGAGKSTLLRLLAGLLLPQQGELLLGDHPLSTLPGEQRARLIAYLSQSGSAHWPITVERIVALGRLPHLGAWQSPGEQDRNVIQRVMQKTDLLQLAERHFPTLSGGERARVLLARALAVEPQILLADEPVAALDLAHQLEVMALLRDHCDRGGAAVVVLHDLRLAAHYCNRLQLLLQGETLACGSAREVLTQTLLQRAYGVQIRAGGDVANAFALTWERSE